MTLIQVLAGAALLSGCPCDSGYPDRWYDDLQDVCEGLPCGWEVEAGDVAQVATFHSAERGMRLALGARVGRALDGVPLPSADEGGAQVSLLAACAPDTALYVEVELEVPAPEGTSAAPERLTLVARLEPRPGQSAGGPLLAVDLPLVLPDGAPAPGGQAVRLTFGVEGPGVCTLDEVHLASANTFDCFG